MRIRPSRQYNPSQLTATEKLTRAIALAVAFIGTLAFFFKILFL